MAHQKLRVAQIGCGAFAAGQDLPNFAEHPGVECRWCCDTSSERAVALAARFAVPNVTVDFHEVLADPEVDFVKIATTHEAHLPIIEAAAAAGKHVFCEKPLALDREEGLQIIRAVRGGGIKLCVDLNRRMSPAMQALRRRWLEHCAEPRHQPWRYVECERELFPEERRSHFLVRVQDDSASYRLVHLDPLHGGGTLIGETVHWMDLACWWFAPRLPVEIQAWGSSRFSHGVHITFDTGDTATVLFHCGGTFDYPKELYEVTAHGALFRSHLFVENEYHGIPGLTGETFPLQRDCLPEVGTEGGLAGFLAKYQARVHGLSNSKDGHDNLTVDKGHRAMLAAFVDAIVDDTPSPCDEMAGCLATHLSQLAIRSIRNRQPYPVPVDEVIFDVGAGQRSTT